MPDVSRSLPGLVNLVDDASRASRSIPTFASSNGASEVPVKSKTQMETLGKVDMSALAGISPHQLAAIVQLIQSGALPTGPSFAAAASTLPPPVSTIQPLDDLQDCEDGEIVDVGTSTVKSNDREDMTTRATESKINRHSAEGKENLPPSSDRISTQRIDNGAAPVARQHDRPPHSRGEDEAKDFIMKLHQLGYGFDVLSKHITNRSHLQQLYSEVGIRVDETNATQQPPKTTEQALPTLATAGRSDDHVEQGLPPKSANPPKATTPIARSEYLAKLAAAKAKTNGTAKPVQSNVKVETPKREDPAPKMASDLQPTPRPTVNKSAATTDLIRQRLEALRASQAAKNLALSESKTEHQPPVPLDISQPSHSGSNLKAEESRNDNKSLAANATEVRQNTAMTGGHMAPFDHNNRLPGLFMAQPPPIPGLQSITGKPSIPAAQILGNNLQRKSTPPQETRKRSRSATHSNPPEPTAKRPFGQSRPGSDDEQLIITPSDDEDELDEDIVRTDSASANSHRTTMAPNAALLNATQDATAQYSSFESNQPSAYDKKVEEIAAIRRLIEEREKRVKVGKKVEKLVATSISSAQPSLDMAIEDDQIAMPLADAETKLNKSREAFPPSSTLAQHDTAESDTHPPAESRPGRDDHAPDDAVLADQRTADPGNGLAVVDVSGDESQSSDEMDTSSESDASSIAPSNHNTMQSDGLAVSSESGSNDDERQSRENSTEAQEYDESSDEMDTNTDGDDSDESALDHDPPPGNVVFSNAPSSTDLNVTQPRPDTLSTTHVENLPEPQNQVRDEESLTHLPEHTINREMKHFVVEVPTDSTPAPIIQHSAQDRRSRAYFTRYESPLIKFRTGIASPVSTQSKDAALDDILCPYETTGGRCNDRTCQYRHFSTLGLSGA